MTASSPAYLLEWDPARVWDADFNVWLDASQYGAIWSPGVTTVPSIVRELGRLRFHGVHSVVADDDYPVNDVGWSIVSEEMLEVLRSVGDFPHEAIPIDVVDASADATAPPAVDRRFYMLHVPEHLDSAFLDEEASVAVRLPESLTNMEGMLSAPTSFVFDDEVLAEEPLPPFFRLEAYPWGPVVSAAAKEALEAAGIRSVRFVPLDDLPSAHFRSQLLDPWALERMVVETRPEEQGLDRHFQVLRSPSCDRATALRMYWFHGPAQFQQYASEDAIPRQQRVVRRLIDAVERRFLAGMYKLRLLYFNPQDDAGYDWTTRFLDRDKVEHYPLPTMMYEATGDKPAEALSPQMRLFRVVAAGDRRAAQQLVMSGEVDLDAIGDDEYGDTALHLAVRHDHEDIVDLLVFQGADLNAQNRLRHTPLHVAAAAGNEDIVTSLLEAGADVNALAHSDRPIQLAARRGHPEVVELLLEQDAKLAGLGSGGLLNDACEGRNLEVLEVLLQRDCDTEVRNVRGDTPLMMACESGWLSGVKLLVDKGADLGAEHEQTGQTSLHTAAQANKADVVSWLLDNGADPQKEDRTGQLPLHLALRSGGREASEALLKGQADDATAALSVAMSWEGGSWETVQLLLKHGADPNAALQRAARYGFLDIVEGLLAYPDTLDLMTTDNEGRTALHLGAARFAGDAGDEQRAHIVKALVKAGAALETVDPAGATPLHHAAAAGNEAVAMVLLDLGAVTSAKTTGPLDIGGDAPAPAGSDAAKVAQLAGNEALAAVL